MGELNNNIDPTGRKSDKYNNNPFWTDFSEDNLSGGEGGGGIDSVIVDDTADTPSVSSDGKNLMLPDYKIGVQFDVVNTENPLLPDGISIEEKLPLSTATQRFEITHNNAGGGGGSTRYWDYNNVGAPKAALKFSTSSNLPIGMALQDAINLLLKHIGDVTWAELRDYVKCIYAPEFIISGGGSWRYPLIDHRGVASAESYLKTSNETRRFTSIGFSWEDTHTNYIYTPQLDTDFGGVLGTQTTKCRINTIGAAFDESEGTRYLYMKLSFYHTALYDGPSQLPNRLTDVYEVTGNSCIDITMPLSQGPEYWSAESPVIANYVGSGGSGMLCTGLIKTKSFNEDLQEPFEIWQYSNAHMSTMAENESLDQFFSASGTSTDECIEIGQPLIIYLAR